MVEDEDGLPSQAGRLSPASLMTSQELSSLFRSAGDPLPRTRICARRDAGWTARGSTLDCFLLHQSKHAPRTRVVMLDAARRQERPLMHSAHLLHNTQSKFRYAGYTGTCVLLKS